MLRRYAFGAALCTVLAPAQDNGQGPVDPGPITIGELDLGTHWYGPRIDLDDLVGKVVLVELWGS